MTIESKTEYIVQYRQRGNRDWRWAFNSADKAEAEKAYKTDCERHPKMQHRLIRETVLKESK